MLAFAILLRLARTVETEMVFSIFAGEDYHVRLIRLKPIKTSIITERLVSMAASLGGDLIRR